MKYPDFPDCVWRYSLAHLSIKYQFYVGLHQISYPALAPAEIRPSFHIRPYQPWSDMAAGYEAGFDHLSMHLPHCVIDQEFIVLQIRQLATLYFIMGMWIIPTSSFPFVFHCWLHSHVM